MRTRNRAKPTIKISIFALWFRRIRFSEPLERRALCKIVTPSSHKQSRVRGKVIRARVYFDALNWTFRPCTLYFHRVCHCVYRSVYLSIYLSICLSGYLLCYPWMSFLDPVLSDGVVSITPLTLNLATVSRHSFMSSRSAYPRAAQDEPSTLT